MKRFVEGVDRGQSTLFPECLEDWIDKDNPVRVIDAFVEALDLPELGFEGVEPAETGRPSYGPRGTEPRCGGHSLAEGGRLLAVGR
jgi:transposase